MNNKFNARQIKFLKGLLEGLESDEFESSFFEREYAKTYHRFTSPLFFSYRKVANLKELSVEERREELKEVASCNSREMQLMVIGDRIERNRQKRRYQEFTISDISNPLDYHLEFDVVKDFAVFCAISTAILTSAKMVFSKEPIPNLETFLGSAGISAVSGALIGGSLSVVLGLLGKLGSLLSGLATLTSYKISNACMHFADQCTALETSLQLFEEKFEKDRINQVITDLLEACFQSASNDENKDIRFIKTDEIVLKLNGIIEEYRRQYLNTFTTHINTLIGENQLEGSKSKW